MNRPAAAEATPKFNSLISLIAPGESSLFRKILTENRTQVVQSVGDKLTELTAVPAALKKEVLLEALADGNSEIKKAGIRGLAEAFPAEAVPLLRPCLNPRHPGLYLVTVSALSQIHSPEAKALLLEQAIEVQTAKGRHWHANCKALKEALFDGIITFEDEALVPVLTRLWWREDTGDQRSAWKKVIGIISSAKYFDDYLSGLAVHHLDFDCRDHLLFILRDAEYREKFLALGVRCAQDLSREGKTHLLRLVSSLPFPQSQTIIESLARDRDALINDFAGRARSSLQIMEQQRNAEIYTFTHTRDPQIAIELLSTLIENGTSSEPGLPYLQELKNRARNHLIQRFNPDNKMEEDARHDGLCALIALSWLSEDRSFPHLKALIHDPGNYSDQTTALHALEILHNGREFSPDFIQSLFQKCEQSPYSQFHDELAELDPTAGFCIYMLALSQGKQGLTQPGTYHHTAIKLRALGRDKFFPALSYGLHHSTKPEHRAFLSLLLERIEADGTMTRVARKSSDQEQHAIAFACLDQLLRYGDTLKHEWAITERTLQKKHYESSFDAKAALQRELELCQDGNVKAHLLSLLERLK